MSLSVYPLGHNFNEIARLETQSHLLNDPLLNDLAAGSHKVLEIGCGVGSNWPLIRAANQEATYLGVDFSATAISEAKGRYSGAHFQEMDATNLDIPSGIFDLAFFKLVLWSIGPAWKRAVAEAFRILSPGGIVYACEPANHLITFEPPRPQVKELIRLWDQEAYNRGLDPSVGLKVPAALIEAGFKDVQTKAFPVVALAQDEQRFMAICDNLRQFVLSESSQNPAKHLPNDLKRKALEEFSARPDGGIVMDFLFVSWARKEYYKLNVASLTSSRPALLERTSFL